MTPFCFFPLLDWARLRWFTLALLQNLLAPKLDIDPEIGQVGEVCSSAVLLMRLNVPVHAPYTSIGLGNYLIELN